MTLLQILNHPIVFDMVMKGIEPKIKAGGLEIEGFYKSDTILLYFDQKLSCLIAEDRYNNKNRIETLSDLVELNLNWWVVSNKRSPKQWLKPAEPWRTIALEMGLLIVKEEVIYHYERL